MGARLTGLIGAALLILGVFAPIAWITFVGNVTALSNSPIVGGALLAVAAASILFVVTGRFKGLLWLGPAALLLLAMALFRALVTIGATAERMEQTIGSAELNSTIDVAMSDSRLEWAWVPLLAGALLLIGAGIGGRRGRTSVRS